MVSLLGHIRDWVIPFLIVLSVLVFVHELGHYLVARLCRVRVETFSIGFGPELFGWNDRSGTRWKVSAVPLGGYVKMFGEHDFDDEPDEEAVAMSEADRAVSFHHKTLRQRAAIIFAGPLANFLFAMVVFAAVFAIAGMPGPLAAVGAVQPDSAAAKAGFHAGDRIVAIDGQPVKWFEDLRRIVSARPDQATRFEVRRGEETLELTAVPKPVSVGAGGGSPHVIGLLGVRPDPTQFDYVPMGPLTAIGTAAGRVVSITVQIGAALWEIITGTRTASELGGPLRIAQLSGEMAHDGVINLVFFMAALSVNLGLINLLPIPMLDGGHLAFYAAEAVRGRPLDRRLQEYGFRFGLVLVILLIVLATWNDLMNLKVFDFVKRLVT